jgi:hypothetical protein
MNDATEMILVECSHEAAMALQKAIEEVPGNKCHVTERRNLDGASAAWIVVATLTVQALPPLLNFLIKVLESNRVKKIKVGEIEVENPTAEEIKRLEGMIADRARLEKKDG